MGLLKNGRVVENDDTKVKIKHVNNLSNKRIVSLKSYADGNEFIGMILKFEDGTEKKLFSDKAIEEFN